MPPFDREAALKSAEKALRLGKIDAAIAEYVQSRRGAAARLEQRQRARRPLRPRQAARQGHRAVHPHRRPPVERRLLSKGRRALQEDPQVQAGRGIRAAEVGRDRRQAGPAGRRQGRVPDGRRAPPRRRRHQGRRRDQHPHRHARSRGSRGAPRRGAGRPRDRRHRHRAPRVPRGRARLRQAGRRRLRARRLRAAFELDPTDWRSPRRGSSTAISTPAISTRRAASRSGAAELKRIVDGARTAPAGPTTCSTCWPRSPTIDPNDVQVRADLAIARTSRARQYDQRARRISRRRPRAGTRRCG